MYTQDIDGVGSVRLRGRPLWLRELQADDRVRVEALLAQVAASDLQMRFFSALRPLPPQLIDHLMRIDPTQRLTVAAVLGSSHGDADAEIVAVARAHRTVGESAEAALLVRSDLKGQARA
jgi:acetyltransferase